MDKKVSMLYITPFNIDTEDLQIVRTLQFLFLASFSVVSYSLLSPTLANLDGKFARQAHVPDPLQ